MIDHSACSCKSVSAVFRAAIGGRAFGGSCLTRAVPSQCCAMQTSPSQLLMPGRDDKLPSRPRVGHTATVPKTSASSRTSREQRTMVDAITFVCALSRQEPNQHLLLSTARRQRVRMHAKPMSMVTGWHIML
jgi:hypothetical protein